jgi:DNA sulfur modification protein DndE
MYGVHNPIAFASYYPDVPDPEMVSRQPITSTTPRVSNVVVSQMLATGARKAGWILGLPEQPYAGVLLRDVTIEAGEGLDIRDARVKQRRVNVAANSAG